MIGVGLLVLRTVVGLTLAAHGAQKLLGWFGGPGIKGFAGMLGQLNIRPTALWAWVAALAELVGGLALAVGLLTPLAATAIAGSMLVAIATRPPRQGVLEHAGWHRVPPADSGVRRGAGFDRTWRLLDRSLAEDRST